MSIKTEYWMQYLFYICLLIITAVSEYFHLVPSGTFLPILTLTIGHFTGATVTPAVRSTIVEAVKNGATHE
jgi:hypothetical protein